MLEDFEEISAAALARQGQDAPIVRLVNLVLMSAVQRGASDIHIEPYERELRVRYRIDGMLHEVMAPPLKLRDAITSRLKIMARLDIAEKRLPQDGRIKIRYADDGAARHIDFRVSSLPTLFGEKLVLRLLDRGTLMLDMGTLGLEPESLARLEAAIEQPWGMVLVTGPTGSGKTNTLYSSIARLNRPATNIMTAEDPIEFNLPGINQVPVRESIGLTFASALRAFLRQDPNIILVGEIRDVETAEIAVKAALTGHLVLSTLHTNDAPSSVTPPGEHGHRAVPRRELHHPHLCAAPRAPPVRALPRGAPHVRGGAGARGVQCTGCRDDRPDARGRVLPVPAHRLQGPRGPLRGDGGDRCHARPGAHGRAGRGAAARGGGPRDGHVAREWPAQGEGRGDLTRGGARGRPSSDAGL